MKKVALSLMSLVFTLVIWFTLGGQHTSAEAPADDPVLPSQVTYMPSTGDQKMLVVLVDFPDRAGLFTGEAWNDVFFGSGIGSFSDYFREVSYNKLRYSGDVVGLDGSGIPVVNSTGVDYIRLPNPITYYADGSYGFDVSPGQFPQNHGGVVYHALQALDTAGFDFSPYADSVTKEVENLLVIFAGSSYAYTQDAINSMEATAYRLDWAGLSGGYMSSGGEKFFNYTFCPDQRLDLSGSIGYIGVCAHENGHGLGLPDLYDFSYTTSGDGYFDIMAYGTFGATSGLRPFHFGAYTKTWLDWLQFVPVSGTNPITITLNPVETYSDVIKLYPNGDNSNSEFFMLENRQPLGFDQDWTIAALCPGLVIWHIDQAVVDAEFLTNSVNTLPSAGGPAHQGIVVVEADGGFDMIQPPLNYGECADTWKTGQTWSDGSVPNSNLWDGSTSGLSVTVVSENVDGSITLTISGTAVYRSQGGLDLPNKIYLPLTIR